MTHNQIAKICREVVMVRLDILENDIPTKPWDKLIFDFAKKNAGFKKLPAFFGVKVAKIGSLQVVEKFGEIVDSIIGKHPKMDTAMMVAYQRHHDYYVGLFNQGKLGRGDKRHYDVAILREQNMLVRPLMSK